MNRSAVDKDVFEGHVVISGTGRAGTSFLIELLTCLGKDTGFSMEQLEASRYLEARAGFERDLRHGDCPIIVKDPRFCDYAAEVLRKGIKIKCVIVPCRSLEKAAASRRDVVRRETSRLSFLRRMRHVVKPLRFAGGLWGTSSVRKGDQEMVLCRKLYELLFVLSSSDIPVIFLQYPKLCTDIRYLFDKLAQIWPDLEFDEFSGAYRTVYRPSWTSHE